MITSGWKFKREVGEPQPTELQTKELLYCTYINVLGICYHQILQLTIGSLTIDRVYLCGTTCRRNEKIKGIKRKKGNLESIGMKGNAISDSYTSVRKF